ncbi:MAG: enoyl-CoA hydratase-related protein [Pseudomonadota bacterium]
MRYSTIEIVRKDSGITYLTLDRPEKRNAINEVMIDDLRRAMDELAADDGVRVVILHGRGRRFCAGADLNWMQAQMGASREQRLASARSFAEVLAALNAMPKLVVGWVYGSAFGGGIGLMACCDTVMVEEETMLRLSETHLGLIPATISPYLMAKLGEAGMRQLAISGPLIDPHHAVTLGLASGVYSQDRISHTVRYEAAQALKAAPGAAAATKKLIADLAPKPDFDVIEHTANLLADQWESAEAQAGVSAFFSKGQAPWSPGD